jgi:hypothetical protein
MAKPEIRLTFPRERGIFALGDVGAVCRENVMSRVVDLIQQVAEIPSFSSLEDRLHPWVYLQMAKLPGVTIERVPEHNLLISVPGDPRLAPIALAAHLDKIDHWGTSPERLPCQQQSDRLVGQLDDAVGVGICLGLAQWGAGAVGLPPLLILLSEMEESYGLTHHPERLVAGGSGRQCGQGAVRLSRHLKETGRTPGLVVTIDTTPLFQGEPGVALYAAPWEEEPFSPGAALLRGTADICDLLQSLDGGLRIANNSNDYATYGLEFNRNSLFAVPSIALEPAISPYHCPSESVFLRDIERVERAAQGLVSSWTRTRHWSV